MTELTEQTRANLDRIIAKRQREGRVPGIVGAVAREGGLVWSEGVGVADIGLPGVPPTADTQFLIASLSKTFTAVLTMRLRDEGKLSLATRSRSSLPRASTPGSRCGRCSVT